MGEFIRRRVVAKFPSFVLLSPSRESCGTDLRTARHYQVPRSSTEGPQVLCSRTRRRFRVVSLIFDLSPFPLPFLSHRRVGHITHFFSPNLTPSFVPPLYFSQLCLSHLPRLRRSLLHETSPGRDRSSLAGSQSESLHLRYRSYGSELDESVSCWLGEEVRYFRRSVHLPSLLLPFLSFLFPHLVLLGSFGTRNDRSRVS